MNQNASQQTTSSTRSSNFITLEAIHVASPCKADWNKMDGDAQTRFCGSCAKHVYNLSAMTRAEAEALVAQKESRLCVRFYQREDGTMLTSDCNVGAATLSMKLREAKFSPLRMLAIVACAVGALLPSSTQARAAGVVEMGEMVAPQQTKPPVTHMMGIIAPPNKAPHKKLQNVAPKHVARKHIVPKSVKTKVRTKLQAKRRAASKKNPKAS